MLRLWKIPAIALLAVAIFAPAATAQRRGRTRVTVQPYTYRVYVGPAYYPRLWYGPGWWSSPYDPWYGPRYVEREREGKVKIESQHKGDAIYVDGGFAGVTGKLKKFSLKPGTHSIELRDSRGHTLYQERVHVIAGKTLEIHADYSG